MDSYCSPSDSTSTHPQTHTLFSSSIGHSHSWCHLCFPRGCLLAFEPPSSETSGPKALPSPSPGCSWPSSAERHHLHRSPSKLDFAGNRIIPWPLPSFPASPTPRPCCPRSIVLMSALHKDSPRGSFGKSDLGGQITLNFSM